ncbi:hypothetical protein P4O66_011648, partial [Electrophorus voltai]
MIIAVRNGEVQRVSELAASTTTYIPTNSAMEDWTALHEAAHCGHVNCMKALLKVKPTSVDKRTLQEQTALLIATDRKHLECVKCLLEAGADPDISNKNKETPLYKGAGVNLQSCEGTTALSEASKHGQRGMIELLLRHHADANKASKTGLLPLHIAAQHGQREIVSLLLPVTSRVKIRQSGITPLHLAAEFNQEEVVNFLIKIGCDVNARLSHERSAMFHDHRTTALYCAVAAGNAGVVDSLLRAGANPNLDPFSPLLVAVRQGSFRIISSLVEHGADVNVHIPAHPTDFPGVLFCTHHQGLLQYLLDNGCQAQDCFRCDHTDSRQTVSISQNMRRDTSQRTHSEMENAVPSQTSCTDSASRDLQVGTQKCSSAKYLCLFVPNLYLQFCEWVTSPSVCHMAAPLISLLLEYTGNVRLCSRVTECLNGKQEWVAIKGKA